MPFDSLVRAAARKSRSLLFSLPFWGFVALLFAIAPVRIQAQWTQVWGDDFNGAAGSAPDPSKWTYDLCQGCGDGEVQVNTNSRANSYLDGNGNLKIALLYDASTHTYSSARLKTAGLYAAGPYGRIEARIQTPYAPGVGSAFWALGNNSVTQGVPWPWTGEIDIMEITANNPGHNGGTLHGGETDGQTNFEYGGISGSIDLPNGQRFDQAFHVFAIQWAPYHVQFFMDGTLYNDVYLNSIGATDIWPFNQSFYLILSAGIGAGNSGQPNGTGFPTYMTVDYVHVYQWSAGAPAAPGAIAVSGVTSNAVTLNWGGSSTTDATYNIYASTNANFTPDVSNLVVQNLTGTSYTQTGLTANTTYYYKVVASDYGGESSPATTTVTTGAPGNSSGVKLNVGGYAVGDYMASEYVLGGNTNYHPRTNIDLSAVSDPAPLQVYQTERWGAAAWTITNLNPSGVYNVRLHFTETAHSGPNQRAFNVSINSQTVLQNFDILAAAGAQNKAVVESFYTKADENGIIEIQTNFGNSTASGIDLNPTINAIEVNPSAPVSSLVGATPGTTTALSINSGGPAIGNFVADEFFNGGDTASTTNTVDTTGVANAAPAAVYQTQRYVPFTYVLTGLAAGATYDVRLHFAETYWTAAGKRIFNVAINGATVLPNFDIFATAGQNKAVVKDFSAKADMYGQIIVQFIYGGQDQPEVNGIETIQTTSAQGGGGGGTGNPGADIIAINAGGPATNGFAADEDFSGGGTFSTANAVNTTGVANAAPQAVYQSEREGVFAYTIPGLTAGTSYGVRLHFAELYWATAGKRVFNVAINGTTVLTNFDIVAATGAANTAVVKSFTATANGSGQIVISFTAGSVDQPAVSGIEVYANAGGGSTGGGGGTSTLPTSNTPDFGPHVVIFNPSMSNSTIQSQLDAVFNVQKLNQFGTQRNALLFKPGTYSIEANIGYYTSIAGLGLSPDDVTIAGDVTVDAFDGTGNATQNFWRSAENLAIIPSSGADRWAVAQAAPFRRMHVRGGLNLYPASYGYASGGYIADSKIDGQVSSISQQQWYSRDSNLGSWTGSVWNMVFSGVAGAPAQHFPNPSYTVLQTTPVSREKPFLYIDSSGNYHVFMPALRSNASGTSWASGSTAGTSIPMSRFYVAKPSDSTATLNLALAQGLNLFLTPGVYQLTETLNVTRANTVILGIGYPTLVPNNGINAMTVADVDGVRLAGLLFDAGPVNTPALLTVGPAGSSADHSVNPTTIQDVFFRIGGANAGSATDSLIVNSNNAIVDHIWAWRADHGNGGSVGWTVNPAATGLIVNGNNVLVTGLFVEHYQNYEVIWNGQNGETIFFQNEMPYDVPNQAAWNSPGGIGYAAYKVANNVINHQAWGLGSYCYFVINPAVNAAHAFEVPNTPGVQFHDIVTVSLNNQGNILNVINNTGGPTPSNGTVPNYLVSYP